MSELKRTPLYPLYQEQGARTIDFGGWDLPVQFSSIKEEHEAVRTACGLFDVSHMGEILVKGQDSLPFLQKVMTNDLSKLQPGSAQYTAMCYENGGTVDDLLTYMLHDGSYLLVVNAANIEKDFAWLEKHASGDVTLENKSSEYALLALQGPKAAEVLQPLVTNANVGELKFFKFIEDAEIAGKQVLLSRTGYTGEDGFELYCRPDDASDLWKSLLEAGKDEGLLPCGLGARDTLRFEAALALYGQELDENITPLEAGLGFAVKLNKTEDFFGKEALKKQKEEGVLRKSTGIEMIDRGIPRTGYKVFKGEEEIGFVTSGTQSPTMKKNIGLALLKKEYSGQGEEIEVEIRGKRLKAVTVKTPFYTRSK